MSFRSLLFACCVLGSRALETVQYGAFLQTATYSVANQLAFFTQNDLNVVFNQVPNSTAAFQSLLDGQYDILTATVDNALNFRFNSHEPVTVLGQLDQGPDLVLASIPSITSIAQLKGKSIMVDSPVSGYAFLLRAVLATHGLLLENGDYSFLTVGGTQQRFSALVDGFLPDCTPVYATILTYPFTVEGEALPTGLHPNILERISAVVSPVTSSAFTIRESSLNSSSETALLTRFMTSMYAAAQFLQTPANEACSVQAIAAQLGVSQSVAQSEYTSAVNAVTGEVSPPLNDFTVNQVGIMNDVQIRNEFDGFASLSANFDFTAALTPGTGQLIDYSVRDAAVAAFNDRPLLGTCPCNGGTVLPGLSDNYLGLCSFACNHGYCPPAQCTCTSHGTPAATNFGSPAGCPLAGEDNSYLGLCSFSCANGYCPPTACKSSC